MIAARMSLRAGLRRWWRQEDGSLTIEFLLFAPMMFWVFLASLAYFDAYRTESIDAKAAMTIADMISREKDYINDTFIDGTYGLLTFLTRGDLTPEMRISVLRFETKDHVDNSSGKDRFQLVWSKVRGGSRSALSATDARNMTDKLPKMTDDERLIVVETWSDYNSVYNLGLQTFWIKDAAQRDKLDLKNIVLSSLIFVAPRAEVSPQTCFNNTTNPANAIC